MVRDSIEVWTVSLFPPATLSVVWTAAMLGSNRLHFTLHRDFPPQKFRLSFEIRHPEPVKPARITHQLGCHDSTGSSHAASVWGHAVKDCGAPITSRIGEP